MRTMTRRITVAAKVEDARALGYLRTLRDIFPGSKIRSVAVAQAYTVDAKLTAKEIDTFARRLTNPLIDEYSTSRVIAPKKYTFVIEIGFHPGVTDNVAKTARQMLEDALGKKLKKDEDVYTSFFVFLDGVSRSDAEAMARELHNPLIERASIYDAKQAKRGLPIVVPQVHLHERVAVDAVSLDVSDDELVRIGKEGVANPDGTRRGPLALSLNAMKTIQSHYRKLKRLPTDIELESLAQTWSEHCKHSIFADPIDEVKEGIYKRYIKGATQKIRKSKGKRDFCLSVFTDNAGGIAFDGEYIVTHKVETHNSPSALDPFGGAITGIVGVNRDALGFGLGAKPIANVYGYCVGDPHKDVPVYRDAAKKQPLLPSRRILEGVIRGVNAGGNQSGIPTPLGFVATDPRYRGKPLVFAGTVGFLPRKSAGRVLHKKKARAGDYIVVAGGRVGLDGIHGATFSSEALASGSPATAVQIGDPITQKKMSDAVVREARDRALYTSITDNGAGGISCSIAEMAKECGGALVNLEKVPLKYPGLSPWQIWISESQERMTFAVPKKHWKELKKLFDRHDVEACVVGEFTASGKCVVKYKGKTIMDMHMEFLHDGRPVEHQKTRKPVYTNIEPPKSIRNVPLEKSLLALLSRSNIGSISFISQQYDHEVQGTSVTKPLQGRGRVNADAGVIQPLPHSKKGVVLSHGFFPWYSDIDTYAMAAASIDAAVRSAVCAGASLEHLAVLDNFCWSSSNTPERLYELKESAKAVYDTAVAYGTPYISGKDSMFNDFRGFDAKGKKIHIAAPPTLLISAIGVIDDVSRAVTIDFKAEGDRIYLIGETHDELGASEYFALLSEKAKKTYVGTGVPRTHTKKNLLAYRALEHAIQKGCIASALSVGRGGLAVALSKSAIGGQLGALLDLSQLPGNASSDDAILFSESQGRVLVSVRAGMEAEFEKAMKGAKCTRIGTVKGSELSLIAGSSTLKIPLGTLTAAYRASFKDW
ncbi:MAG: phosphoribosylformylglycinamidine synthase [Parcubacteria group bacterium Athens0416_74]|nr:MAG: phosphoribosylformylglycinamidine synthase [Parcubacteria group bacterium Athens0416_74]